MFVHDENFALLITWTCYGTWMPGDRRGYVSNTRRPDASYKRKHNNFETPFTANDPLTRQYAAEKQKHATATLDREHAIVAPNGIVDACSTRQWHILRAALMWNHVHVVVTNCPDNGPAVRRILKGVSQNAICKHDGKSQRWWTEKGSDRYLHSERAILTAAEYVANQPNPLAEIVDMQVIDPASGGVYPR